MCSQRYDSRFVITTQRVCCKGRDGSSLCPLGDSKQPKCPSQDSTPLFPHRHCLSGSYRVVCRSIGMILSHWSRFISAGQGGCSQTELREPIPAQDWILPAPSTGSRLLGKALPPFQADNRPFPGKSLHAAVQTDPQSAAAWQQMLGLKGQTHRRALSSAKGKPKLFVPEGGNSQIPAHL